MPAQSGDPISSALQVSLSNGNNKREHNDVTLLLTYSAKQILLSDIKYEEFSYDSTSFLNDLKSKYTVISEKDESADSDNSNKVNANTAHSSNNSKMTVVTNSSSERSKTADHVNTAERTETSLSSKQSLPTPGRTLWPPDGINLGWKPNTPVGGGFINLWNSCYINSTLQALFHIPGFVNWLLMENSHKCPNKSSGSSPDCLICAVSQTLKNSQFSTGKATKPYLIYSRLKSICKHLNPGTQEDAHEFLRHLVDSLDRTYLTPFKDLRLDHLSKETTPLSQIFGGYLRNEVVCQACGHISTTFQYFQDLPLDIANSGHIDGSLDLFFSRESVSEHEGYRCENCKRRVPFTKKFSLEKAPRVLCVQLKRFGAVSGKNNKSICIAGKLNLNRFKAVKGGDNFEPYHLAAVVNHIGTSANCGHYTAIAMAADNKLYLFDDQRVERLHDLAQNSSQAYILLYQQKPTQPYVPNGVKPDLNISKLNSSNTHRNNTSVQSSTPHESAKERLFGKSDVKNSFKIFNSNVLAKVTTSVGNSISNVLSKVNGNGASSSGSSDSNKSSESATANKKGNAPSSPIKSLPPSTSPKPKTESAGKSEQPLIGPVKPQEECKEKSEKQVEESSAKTSDNPSLSRTQNGHKLNENKSLVPYNESSCSSEEGSSKEGEYRPTTPEPPSENPGPSPPKKPRFDSNKDSDSKKTHPNGSSPEKNGVSPSNRLSNGHSSLPGKQKFSNGNSVGVACGKYTNGRGWTVTSRSPSISPAKGEPNKNSWKIKGSDEGRNDYKSQINSMGHRGYGKHVPTWSGEKSEIEKEVARESFVNQRMSSSYNDKYDMPNKKIKKYHGGSNFGYDNTNNNRFNEAQKRKNNWYKGNRDYHHYSGERQRNGDSYYKYRSWNHI